MAQGETGWLAEVVETLIALVVHRIATSGVTATSDMVISETLRSILAAIGAPEAVAEGEIAFRSIPR